MKVYITANALTKGFIEEGEDHPSKIVDVKYNGRHQYFYKGKFFTSFSDAQKDAEAKRLKKIQNLRQQIEKLEKLKF